MRYIEEGIDKYGIQVWFVLQEARLIGMYYTEQEAKDHL
jgi:hypothetical protein